MREQLTMLALVIAVPFAASAAPTVTAVTTDGTWTQFQYGDVGSTLLDDYAFNSPNEQQFSFSLATEGVLRVAEGGFASDQLRIFANGSAVGDTNAVAAGSTDYVVDFDTSYASALTSHGAWLLPAGNYVVQGVVLSSPFGAGIGAIAVSAVPEPSAIALLGVALTVGVALRRRRA